MSSTSRRSPKPFETPSASTTTSPSRGPAGMWISTLSSLTFWSSASSFSYWVSARLRLRVPRLRARAHPLELAGERAAPGRLLLLLDREPRLLLLEPGGVVALERQPLAAVELEDPAGDVVEEVAIVGDGDDGALVLPRGSARARRPTRHRGGSSARRAGAGRARRAAARASATRRRSPPESVVTSRSPSGSRSASIARSSVASRLQASARSICSCTFACSASSVSKSASGSANLAEIGVEAVEQVAQLADAVLDVLAHGSGSGRARAPARACRRSRPGASSATPLDGSSSPAMIRSSVDLPAPFGPSTPILAPGRKLSEMFASTCRSGP